jgi:hypothetical protein
MLLHTLKESTRTEQIQKMKERGSTKKPMVHTLKEVNRIEQMKKVQEEGLELFTRKNKDYGDAFAEYGTVGVLIRIEDKLKRMMSISKTSITMVNEETLRDTLIDLHNYSAMAIMLMDEKTE